MHLAFPDQKRFFVTKSRHDMKVVSTGPVTAVSASNPQLEQLDYRGRAVSPILHRREMLKWMGACGTLWMAGCDPVEDEPEIEG